MTKKRTVILKNYSKVFEEYEANTTITPGMLIELHTDGKVRPHDNADANVLPMFALEDELQGKTIDDDYSNEDIAPCWIPGRGDQAYALLQDDEDVSIGDFLSSNGNGRLKKFEDPDSTGALIGAAAKPVVGIALEALDLSTSTGAWPTAERRIKIRIV